MKPVAVTLAALAAAGVALSGIPPACAASGSPQYGTWGVDLTAMDTSVKPGDDFFRFVNGTWYDKTVVAPDQSRTGVVLKLQQLSEVRLKAIVASLATRRTEELDADAKKLRDFYDSFLDQKAIDAAGLAPARKDLDYIARTKTLEDVARAMARPGIGLPGPFGLGIGVDEKDSSRYSISLGQSGLGMSRDYYLKDDKALAAARSAYKAHLARMFGLAGMAGAERRAGAVYELEYKLARAHWSNVENRDATKTYNPMSFTQLKALAPQFPWQAFFEAAEVPLTGPKGERQVVVGQPTAVPKLAQIFVTTPINVWRDYLTVHYLAGRAAYLPKVFDQENFSFYGAVLNGQTQQRPREVRALHMLDGSMGEALGKLYVAQYFPPAAEAKAVALVNNLLKTYDADIRTLTWMTPATRDKALDKLHHMSVKIGYPPRWRDFSALVVDRHDLMGNVERANLFEERRELARLDRPVDKTEWGYPPQTVNASYNPVRNEIVFPAAILQPPFFDPAADDAVNYGGIGHVIGHEISHGFDDQGSRYDAAGALNDWWTPADRGAFDAKTKTLGLQYDAYEPLPGFHVNGALTMGENIADNAGTAIALKAYHLSLGGKPAPVLDGYTGDQRFFLSLAQVNRDKRRPDALRRQVLTDVHAPSAFRAIGVTRNQDEWYAAFGVKPGEKYYLAPEKRVHIW